MGNLVFKSAAERQKCSFEILGDLLIETATMVPAAHTNRQPLGSVQANQIAGQSLPPFTLPPIADTAQQPLNTAEILAHHSTYGEPVDPMLAQLMLQQRNGDISSGSLGVPTSKRSSAVAAMATIQTVVAINGESNTEVTATRPSELQSDQGSKAAERKARLIKVANECNPSNPPSDADLQLMQVEPLKIVLKKLNIKSKYAVSDACPLTNRSTVSVTLLYVDEPVDRQTEREQGAATRGNPCSY